MANSFHLSGNRSFGPQCNDWRGLERACPSGPIQTPLYRPRQETAIGPENVTAGSSKVGPETEVFFKPEPFELGRACKNLIVNYLPQAFTDKHLFDLFVPYGPLHSVKIMREPKTGYSYGFGFVNFIKVEDAVEALKAVHGRVVGINKRLKVSFARPPSDDIKNTNLYITNLPRSTTDADITEMFGKFGTIVQKNLLYDKRTGIPRGTAFVRYAHRDQAVQAILCMNNYVPAGTWEPIRVKLAQDHGRQKAAYMAGFQDAFHGVNNFPFMNTLRSRPGTCL